MRSSARGPNLEELVFLWRKGGDSRALCPCNVRTYRAPGCCKLQRTPSPGTELARTLICCLSHLASGPLLWQLSKLWQWPAGRGRHCWRTENDSTPPPIVSHSGNIWPTKGAYLLLEIRDRVSSWTLPSSRCSAYSAPKVHPTFPTL